MNYPANTIHHRNGDLVLHDCDAKEPKMVMVVVGYARDGLCKAQYVNQSRRRAPFKNELKYLHVASQFIPHLRHGIQADDPRLTGDAFQRQFEAVRIWNHNHPIGTNILTASGDGGFYAKTAGNAFLGNGGYGLIKLEGHGLWDLKFVEAVRDE